MKIQKGSTVIFDTERIDTLSGDVATINNAITNINNNIANIVQRQDKFEYECDEYFDETTGCLYKAVSNN